MRARLAGYLLAHLPQIVVATPERVIINLAVALVGLSVLVGNRSPALDQLWPFPLYEWAVAMLIGGIATLGGIFTGKRTLERLGMILVLVGCLLYGALVVAVLGERGIVPATIFLAIAAAKVIRLTASSVARSTTIRMGEKRPKASPPDAPP